MSSGPLRPALAGAMTLALAIAVTIGVSLPGGGSSGSLRVIHASLVGVRGTAELRLRSGYAELVVAHMAPPPPGHIYQVWLKRDGLLPSPTTALFSVNAAGAGAVAVPGDLRRVGAVLVTSEPDGGSLSPTHAPVIIARL